MAAQLNVAEMAAQLNVADMAFFCKEVAIIAHCWKLRQKRPHKLWLIFAEKKQIKRGSRDSEIAALKAKSKAGNTSKYVVHDEMLYYSSGKDEEVRPIGLKAEILEQY